MFCLVIGALYKIYVYDMIYDMCEQSASSLPEGNYRGGRKKEPPPPNMTPEQRLMWEQERDKKDKHNDSALTSVAHTLMTWLHVN